MTKEQEQELKNLHSNFLAIPEMRILLENLKKKYQENVDWVLAKSVYGNDIVDSQIRNKAAQTQAQKEFIDYVQDPKSLIRSS